MHRPGSSTLTAAAAAAAAAALAGACLQPIPARAAAAEKSGGNAMEKVSATVAAESRGGRVLVTVTIENGRDLPAYVPDTVARFKEPWGRLFEIREAGAGPGANALVEYTGPLVKRGPLTPDDFVEVAPRGRHSNTLDITRSYAFRPGLHSYRLSFTGTWVADPHQQAAPGLVQAGPVLFVHGAPSFPN